MKNRILFFWGIIMLTKISQGQEYILFEKQQSLNHKMIVPGIFLSQNDVLLKHGDTTLTVFNFYFYNDKTDVWGLDLKALEDSQKDISLLRNDVLICAVPLIKPGEQLQYIKLTPAELEKLKIISIKELLLNTVPSLFTHVTTRKASMPSLKSLKYDLIIKDGTDYFKVIQPVLVSQFIIYSAEWYFPNHFKDGVLNASYPNYIKTYNMQDFDKIDNEVRRSFIWRELQNRIYVSKIENIKAYHPIYHYWEFPGRGARRFSIKDRIFDQAHPGLGSFDFLPKIGVLNCTLYFYLQRETHGEMAECCENHPTSLKITSINSLNPETFYSKYRDSFPKNIRFIE